jgi:hypothetical protein
MIHNWLTPSILQPSVGPSDRFTILALACLAVMKNWPILHIHGTVATLAIKSANAAVMAHLIYSYNYGSLLETVLSANSFLL